MDRMEVLHLAALQISGQRVQDYGQPEDCFQTIADYWNAFLQNRDIEKPLSAQDIALMMVLFKAARLTRNPSHSDSWVDAAGYVGCGGGMCDA